jgi:hypothetical protein
VAAAIFSILAAFSPTVEAQTYRASRAAVAPTIDGSDRDPVWAAASLASDFVAFRPTEGQPPAFRTEIRAVHDDRRLYVLVRAFDPHPDSIIGLLARRDNIVPPNDQIQLYLDPYRDGRSGYQYVVNPVGVKADYLLFDDDRIDLSWDGVWDVATRVDSLGWVAEFAIPFAQLRFRAAHELEFGLMVWRTVGRLGERSSWPAYRPSRAGLVSQFGSVSGISDVPARMRLELAPYALTRAQNQLPRPGSQAHTSSSITGGADVKFGPTPNVTADLTINPDFGQVEADPAILNLSAIETFYPERRPFFLEGAGQFKLTLSRDANSPEQLFYTRRIGRRPSLSDLYGEAGQSVETTILAAGKLTARLGGNMSLASLAALTDAEFGRAIPTGGRYIIEPRTAYNVTRVQRDFRSGRSGVGLMFTGVERDLDPLTESLMPRRAMAGGFSTQHQSSDGQYWARLWVAGTSVRGSAPAMARVQLSSVHSLQRPDDELPLDTTRTALAGAAAQVWLGKTGGATRFGMSYRHLTPGFDPTDIGYINESDHRSLTADVGLVSTRATSWYRNASISLVSISWWKTSDRVDQLLWLNTNVELPSQWTVAIRANAAQLGGIVCAQKCMRGGPAVRKDPLGSATVQVTGDPRKRLIPDVTVFWQADDGGRSRAARLVPALSWRPASNLQLASSIVVEQLRNVTQFYRRYGSPSSDTTHHTIARLEQSTRSLTTRVSYAATSRLSVDWYAQPFLSRGTYTDIRELADPRARNYSQRFRPFSPPAAATAPRGVTFQQFRSNLVTRWDYRPGSVLYVVWSHGRDVFSNEPGQVSLSRDARELFDLHPNNTLAIKASYWYGR